MRKLLNLLAALFIVISLSCQKSKEEVKIFVAWPGVSYLPGYDWKTNEAKPRGIEPELIERILEIAGYDYSYVPDYNYTKDGDVRIDVITEGVADVSIRSITINQERSEKVNFSTPYYYDGISALVLKDSPINSKKDLAGKTIFAISYTTAFDWTKENLPNAKVVSYNDFSSQVLPEELLRYGKVDAILGDQTYLTSLTNESNSYKVLEEKYTREPFGIAVHKEKKQLLEDINAAIKKLKTSGELNELTAEFSN